MILDKTTKKFDALMKKWLKSRKKDDLDNCLLFYLDNFDTNNGKSLYILKHLLENYNYEFLAKILYVKEEKEVKK